jgi:hypothetical protein
LSLPSRADRRSANRKPSTAALRAQAWLAATSRSRKVAKDAGVEVTKRQGCSL